MEDLMLIDKRENLDDVTKLNQMPFFIKQYNKYITEHPNSNLIFVDFAK